MIWIKQTYNDLRSRPTLLQTSQGSSAKSSTHANGGSSQPIHRRNKNFCLVVSQPGPKFTVGELTTGTGGNSENAFFVCAHVFTLRDNYTAGSAVRKDILTMRGL